MSHLEETKSAPRDARGRLLPGHGMGRPKGSRNALNKQVLDKLADLSSDAMAVLKQRLQEGDLKAAVYVIDRFAPSTRTIEINSSEPTAWADALAAGECTPGEAAKAAQALKTLSDAQEVKELRARLDELELLISVAR